MTSALSKRLWAAAACAALLAGASASPAHADIQWLVTGTFNDGGTLSGYFDINVYGYLSSYDLTTTAGGQEAGFEYTKADSYWSNGSLFVDLEPGYKNDLHLDFTDVLTTAVADNPIIGGVHGPSYECVNSWSCYVPQGGVTRYLTSGYASVAGTGGGDTHNLAFHDRAVPEPATWALLIAGLGMTGAAMRRRRAATAA